MDFVVYGQRNHPSNKIKTKAVSNTMANTQFSTAYCLA